VNNSTENGDPVMALFNRNLDRMQDSDISEEDFQEMKAEVLELQALGYEIDLSDLEQCEKEMSTEPIVEDVEI
jgi:hypothetical protein